MPYEERTVRYDRYLGIEAYRFKGMMQKFPNHFHEHYVIGFIEAGGRILSCKNREYTVGAGDIILLNPLDNHACEPVDEAAMDYRSLSIKPDTMKKAVLEITGKDYLPVFIETVGFQSDLTQLLKELHMAVMEEQSDIRKEELYLTFMEQLIGEYTVDYHKMAPKEINAEIQTVCGYIEEHYTEHISLDDLSRQAKINKYSLLRSFAKRNGITPYRYLETVRINQAKKLLEQGDEAVDAAIRTGFSDQSHFTNYFKEFIGLTPKQYQNIFNS
jgi:AraC-like DNA-binding protein